MWEGLRNKEIKTETGGGRQNPQSQLHVMHVQSEDNQHSVPNNISSCLNLAHRASSELISKVILRCAPQ